VSLVLQFIKGRQFIFRFKIRQNSTAAVPHSSAFFTGTVMLIYYAA